MRLQQQQQAVPVQGQALALQISIESLDAGEAGLAVLCGDGQRTLLGYDADQGTVFIDRRLSGTAPEGDAPFAGRRQAPVSPPAPGRPLHMQVWVDAGSVELFADNGLAVITEVVLPGPNATGVVAYAQGGTAVFGALQAWPVAACMDTSNAA